MWKNAFLGHPAPYLTDEGFPNPVCLFEDDMLRRGAQVRVYNRQNHTRARTYVIGENDSCVKENNTRHFCNGPLKPNTAYVSVQNTHTQKTNFVFLTCTFIKSMRLLIYFFFFFFFVTTRFKFRATNTKGQYTDSEYSDHIRTKGIL